VGTGTGSKLAEAHSPSPDEDSGRKDDILRRIRNLDLAAQRVHRGWEELLNLDGFQVAPNPEQYERLFTYLLRVAAYPVGEHHYGHIDSWGRQPVCQLEPSAWNKWYARVVHAFDPPDAWDKQLESVTFLAVNYWNHLVTSVGGKIFAPWLPAELNIATPIGSKGRSGPSRSPLKDWKYLAEHYRALTEEAARDSWYTANKYLSDFAPRKRAVTWCLRSVSSALNWDSGSVKALLKPPSMSETVARLLRVAVPSEVLDRKVDATQFAEYRAEIKSATGGFVWKLAAERFNSIKEELKRQIDSIGEEDLDHQTFNWMKALVEIIGERHDNTGPVTALGGEPPSDAVALADYLVHLCIYLNTTLFPRESVAFDGYVHQILGIDQCAFMARSLREYYGGDTISIPGSTQRDGSYFYSIPVFVPAWKSGEQKTVKTSILGMGTDRELSPDEVRGWLHVAEQLVLPAQQQDVVTDEQLGDAQTHLDAVIHTWRWDLQKISANVEELDRFASRACVIQDEKLKRYNDLRTHTRSSLDTGFLRCDLLERILQRRQKDRPNRRDRPFEHELRRLDNPDEMPSGSFPLRYIALEALLRGFSGSRENLQAEIADPYTLNTLTDEWMQSELMRVDPGTKWLIQVPAFNNICVNWQVKGAPAASLVLILEEWASNVKKHRLWHPSTQPWARISIKDRRNDVVCELANGPSGADPVPEFNEGHGLSLIRLCFEELAGQKIKPTYAADSENRREGIRSWSASYHIPSTRWKELW
jgi:hypothetical protein